MTAPRRIRPSGRAFRWELHRAEWVGRGFFGLRGSPYANPHNEAKVSGKHPDGAPCRECGPTVRHTRAEAVELYRQHLREHLELVARARRDLPGRDLACMCDLPATGEPDVCHAAVLLAVVAGEEP